MRRRDARAERIRREHVQREIPPTVDLLAAVLVSGAPVHRAVSVVASAIDGPLREPLTTVASALELGADVGEAWRIADPGGDLATVADCFERSARSGAPLAGILIGLAGDERRRRRQALEAEARIAGVRAILPLVA